ncbi:glycosyltransferase family 2 protein [Parabacteroides sp. OttesenSCG-928-G07]|nr:glycosyltransferase family 2 protein [Parabacteroides sp. OttesenSCG-928-G21]MDL2278066.1 glycosyltransferase family 2 protein [Parabacteroides sp. OttesenSCG-928-G07]
MTYPILDILISTLNGGINNIPNILLPARNDVRYIISHQITEKKFKKIPSCLLKRNDVLISQITGKGVNKSRNNAMRLSTGKICLFADDDVIYKNEYLDIIIKSHQDNPNFDIIVFKALVPYQKKYPDTSYEIFYTNRKHSIMSIEISFKADRVREKRLLCDERFGLGNPITNGGSEVVFIFDAFKNGLRFLFIPQIIVEHPQENTIRKLPKYAIKKLRVSGALNAKKYGWISICKIIYETITEVHIILKDKANPISITYEKIIGALYILKTQKYKYKIEEYELKNIIKFKP